MLRLLHLLNKLLLLHTPLTLHPPIQQNTLELLHPQLGQILGFQILRLDGELDPANLGITLINTFTQSIGRHPEREGLGHVAFDGVDVVAYFLFARREGFVGAVRADCGFDFGFVFLIGFGHGVANVGHYFHAD